MQTAGGMIDRRTLVAFALVTTCAAAHLAATSAIARLEAPTAAVGRR